MKRSHDKAEDVEDGPNSSGVLDPSKVYDIQKKEIWIQMNYYKSVAKKCEDQLSSFKHQIDALRHFLLACLFHFSPKSDPKSVIEELLNDSDGRDIDETLVEDIKRASSEEIGEVDILRARLSHSKLKSEEYEKLISEIREELHILQRRSFKYLQSSKSPITHATPREEPSTALPEGGSDELKRTIGDQRDEISALIQKCSSLEKEKESLAHLLRVIPPKLFADPPHLNLILSKYQEIEENNRTLNSLVERYKKDFDAMYSQSKSSIEDLKRSCAQDIEVQHEKMKAFREESGRLRQERDKMRTLYEENNSALSHANKKINHLQKLLSSLEMKHASSEEGLNRKKLLTEVVIFSTLTSSRLIHSMAASMNKN